MAFGSPGYMHTIFSYLFFPIATLQIFDVDLLVWWLEKIFPKWNFSWWFTMVQSVTKITLNKAEYGDHWYKIETSSPKAWVSWTAHDCPPKAGNPQNLLRLVPVLKKKDLFVNFVFCVGLGCIGRNGQDFHDSSVKECNTCHPKTYRRFSLQLTLVPLDSPVPPRNVKEFVGLIPPSAHRLMVWMDWMHIWIAAPSKRVPNGS